MKALSSAFIVSKKLFKKNKKFFKRVLTNKKPHVILLTLKGLKTQKAHERKKERIKQ